MRIVSKSARYNHLVRNEVAQIGQDENGVLRRQVVKPQIWLEFRQSGLVGYDIEFAMQFWSKRDLRDPLDPFSASAWGAHPDTRDGAMAGQIYTAWRPTFSVYDTDWADEGDVRDTIIKHFTEHPEGQDYVVVQPMALKPPWPSYDSMHASKIAPFAADAGVLVEALKYEVAMQNRESVVAALQKKTEEAAQVAAEDAALTVRIP
jgi:hypothetical protein